MKITQNRLVKLRRTIQLLSFMLMIYIIWSMRYPLDRFVNPKIYFYLDPLVMFTTAIAERVWLSGIIFASVTFIATIILGRVFCGWICPLGVFFDGLDALKKKLLWFRKKPAREKSPVRLRHIKLVIFGAIFIAALAGIQLAWIIDPMAIFVRTFSFVIHPLINHGIESSLATLIQTTESIALEDLYNFLREGFIGTTVPQFPHTRDIVIIFLILTGLTLIKRRFWCRYLCPLGALLSLPARLSPFKRVTSCGKQCRICMHTCRMNAINPDNSYIKEECILCLDCLVDCPDDSSTFSFVKTETTIATEDKNSETTLEISRHAFLKMAAVTSLPFLSPAILDAANVKDEKVRPLLRPPGAIIEDEFIQRCIRCGNCMKVCPTNVLKPTPAGRGLENLWSPHFDTSLSYCEFNCNLCGQVCPTGAIEELTLKNKQQFIIGTAVIDKDICIPFKKGINCIVCEEHCPVPVKAIKIKHKKKKGKLMKFPVIDKELCIGCGICEIKCPTKPKKAIIILPRKKK